MGQVPVSALTGSWVLLLRGEPYFAGAFANYDSAPVLTIRTEINYIVGLMTKPISLGEFEQVVLLAILRLGHNAYGVTIRSEIGACTGREPAPGALYTTLDRMEQKRIVHSWLGDATPQRGGRAKRYFVLTKLGRVALVEAQRAYQSLLDGLDLLEGANA